MPTSKSTNPINFTLAVPHVLPSNIKSILVSQDNITNYANEVLNGYDPDVTCVVSIYEYKFRYLVATYNTHFIKSSTSGEYRLLKHKDFAEYLLLYSINPESAYHYIKELWDSYEKNQ